MMITKLKIRTYGDSCLRKKSSLVKDIGPSERMLIKSMIETMHGHNGIGLAAPQIGINQRIIVIDVGNGPLACVNPKVLKKIGSCVFEEGCLSCPNVAVPIKRAKKIILKFKDENNNLIEREFDELAARAILHEIDHLDGKMIVDYASLSVKFKLKKQLKETLKM